MSHRTRSRAGFTLTELAIVLAVVGVLGAGIYNLLSGANQQVRDQSAADQQGALSAGIKAFLASSYGQNYMVLNASCPGGCAPGSHFPLPLPTTTLCPDTGNADANLAQLCNYLPPGFLANTTNAYGQSFLVQVLRDNTSATGSFPQTYSFMIKTTAGQTISDPSGARISSLIGGDGGFIYTNNVCGIPTASTACGAFGGWKSVVTTNYGFLTSASGQVASRTYVSPEVNSFNSWLARVKIPGDTTFSLNSMVTPEYLGGNDLDLGAWATAIAATGGGNLNMQGGAINFSTPTATSSTGTMNVQGGTINLGGGTITENAVFGNPAGLNLSATGVNSPTLVTLNIDGTTASESSAMTIITHCTRDTNAQNTIPDQSFPFQTDCVSGLDVLGDQNVAGELNANSLFANTFIYQSSDIRLKTNIVPIDDSLVKLMRLKPVTFNFRANGAKGVGFVAQDVEGVYPEIVSQSKSGMKAVAYDGLIAPLVSAVQELKRDNDTLRAQLHEEQAREERLEQKLDALK